MNVLVITLSSFVFAFLFHVALWRFYVPKREFKFLFWLFSGLLFLVLFYFKFYNEISFITIIHIIFFYYSIVAVYLLTYTGLQATSPSFLMLMKLKISKQKGLTESDFLKSITNEKFIDFRLKEMAKSALVKESHCDKYVITEKGRKYLKVFLFYRNFFGIENTGG